MPQSDGLQYAAQFQLDSLTIVSASGGTVDIREIMREVNIYEDLFSNAMTGSVFMNDTQDLINLLPITGNEYLVLTLVKPSTTWRIQKTFRIYKISDRRKNTPGAEDYVLHFCSEEVILNQSIKISTSYKQMKISAMIKDITLNFMKIDPKKFPASELIETTGNFDVVVPFWDPFFTINWLARMARTANFPGCSFVFFEDSRGFHFNSIESMVTQEPIQVINFAPMNMAGQTGEKEDNSDTEIRLQSAEDIELTQTPDTLNGINTGQFASKLMRVNILDQQVKESVLAGVDFFNTTNHPNRNTFLLDPKNRLNLLQSEQHDAYYRVAVDNNKVETWMLQRNAYLAALHAFQVQVSLPGNMNMRVGQVITLNLPAASIGRREEKPMDRLYSGNYLITAIRHKIDRVKYSCIVELSKDSLDNPLPGPLEGNPTMNKLRQS
jgi:hypothetical protein